MQSGYFATAWADIKNSPGWFGKLCLLALVSFIPIFGPIAVAGYLYGWARDMAWNIHKPLPEHIFGNEDGKQYSRGFFYYIISIVFFLIPSIIDAIYGGVVGATTASSYYHYGSGYAGAQVASAGIGGVLVSLITIVLYVAGMFFIWVGTMRMSIYGHLSAGLQFGKIWAMMKHDANGLWRIFGMVLLVGLIIGIVFCIVISILSVFGILAGVAGAAPFLGNSMGMGNSHGYSSMGSDYSSLAGAIVPLIIVGVIVFIVISYLVCVAAMFLMALEARALGYWTRQFDVAQWRGQDDPMPFELQGQAGQYAQPGATNGQPNQYYGQSNEQQGQQPYNQQQPTVTAQQYGQSPAASAAPHQPVSATTAPPAAPVDVTTTPAEPISTDQAVPVASAPTPDTIPDATSGADKESTSEDTKPTSQN